MQDDELMQLLKQETPYLPDEGFSQKVMDTLPRPNRFRQRVIGASWSLSIILGLAVWISGGEHSLTVFSTQPAVWLSAATLAFWAIWGCFFMVAKGEGLLDI